MTVVHFEREAALRLGRGKEIRAGKRVHQDGQQYVHVQDRAALAEANELIARFGEHAGLEAAQRASRSRSLGNVIHFCHWKQIERTIEMLSAGEVTGTIN